jgi:hypothetical protein
MMARILLFLAGFGLWMACAFLAAGSGSPFDAVAAA